MATQNPAFDYESERRKRAPFSNPAILKEFLETKEKKHFGHL